MVSSPVTAQPVAEDGGVGDDALALELAGDLVDGRSLRDAQLDGVAGQALRRDLGIHPAVDAAPHPQDGQHDDHAQHHQTDEASPERAVAHPVAVVGVIDGIDERVVPEFLLDHDHRALVDRRPSAPGGDGALLVAASRLAGCPPAGAPGPGLSPPGATGPGLSPPGATGPGLSPPGATVGTGPGGPCGARGTLGGSDRPAGARGGRSPSGPGPSVGCRCPRGPAVGTPGDEVRQPRRAARAPPAVSHDQPRGMPASSQDWSITAAAT